MFALKLTMLVAVVGAFAIGCKGDDAVANAAPVSPKAAVSPKPNGAGGGGPASMNAKSMTLGPGTSQFGSKAGGGN